MYFNRKNRFQFSSLNIIKPVITKQIFIHLIDLTKKDRFLLSLKIIKAFLTKWIFIL